jgi:Flp pilus assembly protein TadG
MATMTRLSRGRFRSERGAELIEMMLVTPLLLLIFASIFDFAVLFRGWETVTNAAREGARVASLPAFMDADDSIRQRVEQYMQSAGLASACTLETITAQSECPVADVPGACSVCVKPQTIPTPDGGSFSARSVTVVFKQQLPTLSGVAPLVGGSAYSNVSVGSTSLMRTEAPATGP